MNEPTAAQVKEFWIKCGLKMGTCGWLYHPDNPVMPIYPPIDLNSLFMYAVPRLHAWTIGSCLDGEICAVAVQKNDKLNYPYKRGESCDKDPAHALFLACREAFGLGGDT